MRILLVATTAEKGALAANLAHHREMLELAAVMDCDIAVFPEFSLTGSVDAVLHPERSVTVDDDAVGQVIAETRRLGIAAVFGIGERDGEDLYITQLFAAEGELRGSHRKRVLGDDETGFEVGGEPSVFAFGGSRFGIVICAEAGTGFIWSDLAAADASLVFFCAAPGLDGRREDDEGWRAGLSWWEECGLGDACRAAREHSYWIALTTQAGSTIDEDFPGLAALVDPDGEVVVRTPDWRPATLAVEVPETGRLVG
jgi:predicted amidohydrolase